MRNSFFLIKMKYLILKSLVLAFVLAQINSDVKIYRFNNKFVQIKNKYLLSSYTSQYLIDSLNYTSNVECAIRCSASCLAYKVDSTSTCYRYSKLPQQSDYIQSNNEDSFFYKSFLPKSCKEILSYDPLADSGLYQIYINDINIEVFCEMRIEGGGYTILPNSIFNSTLFSASLFNNLFRNRTNILVVNSMASDTSKQNYSVVAPINKYSNYSIQTSFDMVKRNIQYLFAPYNVPVSQTIRGFKVNGIESLFLNCDTNPNCMFIFWSIQTSPNKTNGDFCVTSLMNSSLDYKFKIPEQFFNSLQINMGGCGCWTLSLNWRNYFGAAFGIR